MQKLEVRDLCKSYEKEKKALDGVTINFENGVYGLLGPNGAGKSTLMNLLTLNLKPDSGEILWNGKNINEQEREYKRQLGYMPQMQNVYSDFTLEGFLYYMSALKGLNKKDAHNQIDVLLKNVNLLDARKKRLGGFSGGMRQRALIAQALLGDPKILILDEPTAGLDPKERIRIRNIISKCAIDKIVIIATHIVSDIEFIADNIILQKEGCIIKNATPVELTSQIADKVYEMDVLPENVERICEEFRVSSLVNTSEGIKARVVSDCPIENMEYKKYSPNLEDVYLYYFDKETGR